MTTPDKAFTVDFVARTSKVTAAGTSTWWCTLVLNNSVLLKNARKCSDTLMNFVITPNFTPIWASSFVKRKGARTDRTQLKKLFNSTSSFMMWRFTCDVCSKTFATKGYLQQHFRIHDQNFVARCGEKCKNPTTRKIHQKDCKKCAAKQRKFRSA